MRAHSSKAEITARHRDGEVSRPINDGMNTTMPDIEQLK